MMVVSIRQQYSGHAKQAALAALGYYPMSRKFVIVVDDDMDPTNMGDVLFSMGNRFDPLALEIVRGNWVSKLDPLLANPEIRRTKDITCSTLIILACKPFHWKEEFPDMVTIAPDTRKQVQDKWRGLLDSI